MRELSLFFDFMSPYSCLAWQWWTQQGALRTELLDQVHYLPISMGSLISSFETKGPAEIPVKRDYLFKVCLKQAQRHSYYMEIPYKLPFNPVMLQRLALKSVSEEWQEKVIDAIFRGIWELSLDMESPEVVSQHLSSSIPHEKVTKMIDLTSSKEARLEQRSNQAQALKRGAFGVPSFFVGEELFWGFDAREDLVESLQKNDQFDQTKFNKFLSLFPSS